MASRLSSRRAVVLAWLAVSAAVPLLLAACEAGPARQAEAAPVSGTDIVAAEPQLHHYPPTELQLWLFGVHVKKSNIREWWNANHYCQQLRPDLIQCATYDTTTPGTARLMGIEYVVPNEVYQSFPAEERQYWHPHTFEVNGGLLDAPDLPADSARKILLAIRPTWGKVWHLWQSDLRYPTGTPVLGWAIEGADSIPPGVVPSGNAVTRQKKPAQ